MAQGQGEWGVGAKVKTYSRLNGATGVGLFARYGLGSGFRLEPSLIIFTRSGMSVDISTDIHYPFNVSRGFEVYPIAGLSINDLGSFGLGLNVGAGAGYHITDRIHLDLGAKWAIQTQRGVNHPIIISIGSGYKF